MTFRIISSRIQIKWTWGTSAGIVELVWKQVRQFALINDTGTRVSVTQVFLSREAAKAGVASAVSAWCYGLHSCNCRFRSSLWQVLFWRLPLPSRRRADRHIWVLESRDTYDDFLAWITIQITQDVAAAPPFSVKTGRWAYAARYPKYTEESVRGTLQRWYSTSLETSPIVWNNDCRCGHGHEK